MHIFYEEDGQFKVGTILSEAGNTYQVETQNGKRLKLKQNIVLLTYNNPSPSQLLEEAQAQAATIDIRFVWECAPDCEFAVKDFAADYYGGTPTTVEVATLIIAIHSAPVYFHRKGKGLYKAAPPDILEAALAAIEKKKIQTATMEAWTQQLVAGTLPSEFTSIVSTFLHKPDKNSLEWKAFEKACTSLNFSVSRLLYHVGVLNNLYALHKAPFLAEHFPKGIEFPEVNFPTIDCNWPLSPVTAYSIDDDSTTEIDDALSVTALSESTYRIGIHIAVPALMVHRDSELDGVARKRLSTVYLPGEKFPMQPPGISHAFSLDEGKSSPCVSLYCTFDANTSTIDAIETTLERITVTKNLRIQALESVLTEAALDSMEADFPYRTFFQPLWQFAHHRTKVRDTVRGGPEKNQHQDYSFTLAHDPNSLEVPRITITPRVRGNPIDKMTSECMIFANETWAGLLKNNGVPGIFRSHQAGRVRVSTHPDTHETIGVQQYGWFTSPLRRYIDLTNQRQLLAVIEHGISARLVAPFKPKEADLFSIITQFETAHVSYQKFQRHIENYWTIEWLKQEGISTVEGHCFKEGLVRLDGIPFITKLSQLPPEAIGQKVRLQITEIDQVECTIACTLLAILPSTEIKICPEEEELIDLPETSPADTNLTES